MTCHDNKDTLHKVMVNLYGVEGIGKTGTLLELIELIKNDSSFKLTETHKINQTDISLIGNYKGKMVGVLTADDPVCHAEVAVFLDNCLRHNCKVIFVASRTRGYIYDTELDFANTYGYTFIKTSPLCICNSTSQNYKPLHLLFAEMLESVI